MTLPDPIPTSTSQHPCHDFFYSITADGSTLNIHRALTSDMGKYTCVATNPAGEEDRIFNLNVYGKYEMPPGFDFATLRIH